MTLTPHGRDVLGDATGDLVAAVEAVPSGRRDTLAADLQNIAAAMAEKVTVRARRTSVGAPPSVGHRPMSEQSAAS